MILRAVAILVFITSTLSPAAAQQRVMVITQRLTANGPLFLAAARGYFKAEGLDIAMGAYAKPQDVVEAVAAGRGEFGLAAFSPAAFNLAGRGAIKMIAAQAREWSDYEGDEVIASNAAYARGLHTFKDLDGKTIAIDSLGSTLYYQLGRIASAEGFAFAGVTVKPLYSLDAMAAAVAAGKVDAAVLPARYARDLMVANQGKLIGLCSEIDTQQLGALFTASTTIASQRATVEKFVRAYRRGVADYAQALLRHDRFGKRISDASSHAAAKIIAGYVYPDNSSGIATVEASANYMDPKARLDVSDLARQIAWLKAQGFVDENVEADAVVDLSFLK